MFHLFQVNMPSHPVSLTDIKEQFTTLHVGLLNIVNKPLVFDERMTGDKHVRNAIAGSALSALRSVTICVLWET